MKPIIYRAPPIIDAPGDPRIARLRDRLANWGNWCRGQGMCVPDGHSASLSAFDSGDPMVRDEGWGTPAPPADILVPVNAMDAREIEDTVHQFGRNKPGHVFTLSQCYVRVRPVVGDSRVRAEVALLGILDKRRTQVSTARSEGIFAPFRIISPA
jgi:hypothetical protein